MKHEVFIVSGDNVHRGHRGANRLDTRGLGGLENMALQIREAYNLTAEIGGKIIAAHTVAYQLSANEEDSYHQDETEGECLFLVAEIPDDSEIPDTDYGVCT